MTALLFQHKARRRPRFPGEQGKELVPPLGLCFADVAARFDQNSSMCMGAGRVESCKLFFLAEPRFSNLPLNGNSVT
jgi:hypothetical protein